MQAVDRAEVVPLAELEAELQRVRAPFRDGEPGVRAGVRGCGSHAQGFGRGERQL
jgi:hypothetical protein